VANQTANLLSFSTVVPALDVRLGHAAYLTLKRTGLSCSISAVVVAVRHSLLQDPDPAVHMKAARDWCEWENSLLSVDPDAKPAARRLESKFQLAFARIVTHYFSHHAWLEDGILLREAGALAGIPGIMVHGRLDFGGPLVTAWELDQAWPDGELVIVGGADH